MPFYNIIVSLTALVVLGLFGLQYNLNRAFKKLANEYSARLQQTTEAHRAQKELSNLQEESANLEAALSEIERKIPENKVEPYPIIKELAAIGEQFALAELHFISEGDKGEKREAEDGAAPSSSGSSRSAKPAADEDKELKSVKITMSFSADYSTLLNVLRSLLDMERIISIRDILIERSKTPGGLQSIELVLVAYSF